MASKPWGGNHANLLHSLRPQRAHRLTGGNYPGLCEALLPVPGCKVRAHLGVRTYVQAFPEAASTTRRHSPSGENQKFAGGAAARAIAAGQRFATSLTLQPRSQPPQFTEALPFPSSPCVSLHVDLESCFEMPAPQAYKPPTRSPLIFTILERRNPRSGRSLGKFAPKNFSRTAVLCPRALSAKLQLPSARSITALCSLVLQHGAQAIGLGAGHCPAARRARSPRPS